MKKIIANMLPVFLLCVLFFCIGFGCSESLNSKDKVETVSDSKEPPLRQTFWVEPKEEIEEEDLAIPNTPEKTTTGLTKSSTPNTVANTEPEPEPISEPEPMIEETTNEVLLGSDFKLYHYAPTGEATASGRMPVVGTTVAVDPKYIKLGTWLRIEIPDGNGGYLVYRHKVRADDTGGDIKGHVLDVFVGSESEARQCGVIRNARVYIIEE